MSVKVVSYSFCFNVWGKYSNVIMNEYGIIIILINITELKVVVSVLDLSSVTYFPACTNVNGTVGL